MESDIVFSQQNPENNDTLSKLLNVPREDAIALRNAINKTRVNILAIKMGVDSVDLAPLEREYFSRETKAYHLRTLAERSMAGNDQEGFLRYQMEINRIIYGLDSNLSDDEVNSTVFKRNLRCYARVLGIDDDSSIEEIYIETKRRNITLYDLDSILGSIAV